MNLSHLALGCVVACAVLVSGCAIEPPTPPKRSTIVVYPPRLPDNVVPGDFNVCPDGRVIVYPVASPQAC